eukprot:115946_1
MSLELLNDLIVIFADNVQIYPNKYNVEFLRSLSIYTSFNIEVLLEIIHPILFAYIDSITIRNIILSFNTLKYKPKCLMSRYWSKNERIFRLNKYKIAEKKLYDFEYELIRINITSPQQFLSFYWENDKFQHNIET